jgi:hypothetical protein
MPKNLSKVKYKKSDQFSTFNYYLNQDRIIEFNFSLNTKFLFFFSFSFLCHIFVKKKNIRKKKEISKLI